MTKQKQRHSISIPCPKCQNRCSVEAFKCSCGYIFRDPIPNAEHHQLPTLTLVPPVIDQKEIVILAPTERSKIKYYFFSVGFFLITVVAAGTFWNGMISTKSDVSPLEPSETLRSDTPSNYSEYKVQDPAPGTQLGSNTAESATSGFRSLSDPGRAASDNKDPEIRSNSAASPPSIEPPRDDIGSLRNAAETRSNTAAANKAVAVAKCADGTYSYRGSGADICFERGGVAAWLDEREPVPSTSPQTLAGPAMQKKYRLGPNGGCYFINADGSKSDVDKSLCL